MKRMIRALFSLWVIMMIAPAAFADPNVVFTWTPPVQYEDGSVIPANDPLSYNLYCGSVSGGPYSYTTQTNSDTPSTEDLAGCVLGVPGIYYIVVTATSTTFGSESAFSNEVLRTFTTIDIGLVPLPPVLLDVQ